MACPGAACRSIEREGQPPLFFHISELAGGTEADVAAGAEVSFSVVLDAAGRTEKYNAVALELLPAGTLAEERSWPGEQPSHRSWDINSIAYETSLKCCAWQIEHPVFTTSPLPICSLTRKMSWPPAAEEHA